MPLIGIGVLSLAHVAHAQTLGVVEQRLDRLEKVTRQLQRETDTSARSSNSRDEVYFQLDRRLGAVERTVASLVSAQERDHRELASTVEQFQRMKRDVEARLDSVESQAPSVPVTQTANAIPEKPRAPLDADARFKQAMGYAVAEDWVQAEFAFDTFIASYPSDARIPEGRYQLGRAFHGQGKYAQAAQTFLDLYQNHPDAPFAVPNLFALGGALAAMGPTSSQQACDVYGEIEAAHGSDLSLDQRSRLLDRRLLLKCSN
ncbi:MAG: tetratricopeptide repeat protein [Sphingobium limneticum]